MDKEISTALDTLINGELREFMPTDQRLSLVHRLRKSGHGLDLARSLNELARRLAQMPQTYEQSGRGDETIVHLHYRLGPINAWITEKDVGGGVDQAFGLVNLRGQDIEGAELGYVSIREFVDNGVALDLHWSPQSLGALRAAQQAGAL